MARIQLTNGFALIPEGIHIFRISEVIYDEDFGKILIKMVTAQGANHTERFFIKDNNDKPNERALNAFSYFAKTVMNDFSMDSIEPEQLVNHYIKAEVIHTKVPSTKDPSKQFTYVNLGEKFVADGFEETQNKNANISQKSTEQNEQGMNLDELLG